MPIGLGEHADVMRAIGRLLEGERADGVQLVNNGAFLTISWRSRNGGAGERHYLDQNLDDLLLEARNSRGNFHASRQGGLADLLRTLGQDLDREQVNFTQITQNAEGMTVSGSIDGRYVRRTYYAADLLARSQRRRAGRHGTPSGSADSVRAVLSPVPLRETTLDQGTHDEGPLSRRLRG